MVRFGSNYIVTVFRNRGTANERSWRVRAGGNLSSRLLLQREDRLERGDQVECELLDEPRVVDRITPDLTSSGVSSWTAMLVPKSEWDARQRLPIPHMSVSGDGVRVNIATIDQSTQIFERHESGERIALRAAVAELRAQIAAMGATREASDALANVEQIESELRHSTPEKAFIWRCVERLNSVAELGQKLATLVTALRHSGLGS